ncbi:SDR family oxidoreductase [Verrucomicrobiota bacterium]
MRSLQGKNALVTGAARRIGKGIALALAEQGAGVAVHYHSSPADAESVADEIRSLGSRAWTLEADLSLADEAEGLVSRAIQAAGSLEVLVNSASVFGPSTLADFTPEELTHNIGVNAMAPMQISRAFAREGREGDIVNMLDARIDFYDPRRAAYQLSKRMFRDMTRMAAVEFAPLVRVNAVAPGLVLPPPDEDEEYLKKLSDRLPLKRVGTLEGLVHSVLFLLQSDFLTGQVIFYDGGYHLKGMSDG